MDDTSACLKTKDIHVFHNHLNSNNPNIQFTVELPSSTPQGQTIAFLDTRSTVDQSGNVVVSVHRKATHTNKYLDYTSHSPAQSTKKDLARQQVLSDLKVNGYPDNFIEKCCTPKPSTVVQTQDADTRRYAFESFYYPTLRERRLRASPKYTQQS